ncbi:hypothetical protein [Rhizobium sp. BK176]|uniref:hypothetical protein n=1 Tax=Rhizobium sp. BK176 TaxID=2587071 RepID=UPI00216A6484|nr:hypothetical protein [Rhizobium sp. BK176]MCS4088425.1 hypothetical protein [Rhizobium sp. BK176]
MDNKLIGIDPVTHDRLVSEAVVRIMATAVTTYGSPEAKLAAFRFDVKNAIDLALAYQWETIVEEKIEGLESDLESAVQAAYNRGAVEWAKLNYPTWIERLETNKKATEARAKC